ncbi:hypothetical protein BIW11_03823 [Tropilaelaps mercedesae]|uniref:Uncharacterized protein n=1 Tax=Tropilaelaps mercedesae TaxID=418985 RepID=A0A1V9XFA5_9ACAR|nr:hypothetical protein BIW11_03823 [Tropilaelaps mercedesae]
MASLQGDDAVPASPHGSASTIVNINREPKATRFRLVYFQVPISIVTSSSLETKFSHIACASFEAKAFTQPELQKRSIKKAAYRRTTNIFQTAPPDIHHIQQISYRLPHRITQWSRHLQFRAESSPGTASPDGRKYGVSEMKKPVRGAGSLKDRNLIRIHA